MKFQISYEVDKNYGTSLKALTKNELNALVALMQSPGGLALKKLIRLDIQQLSHNLDEKIPTLNERLDMFSDGMIKGKRDKALFYAHIDEFAKEEIKSRVTIDKANNKVEKFTSSLLTKSEKS